MKINIVGAGISGLVAAIQLEKAGFKPHIFETSTAAGGRVKTEVDQGIAYDHGFQVLLEAYPLAQKYLDYPALELQAFFPGALVFKDTLLETPSDILAFYGPL
jgi:phytoene dehydrogenase-like protein